ncbi:MAG: pilus assembly protein [Clostridiales bacterium]|nr:pilus assembly protein [Clostridiales bacterium]
MKALHKKVKASTTLEAVIIMPAILIMLLAVFFAFQLIYQNVVLEYAASYGATRGAMLWDYELDGINFDDGTVGDKVNPYENVLQLFGSSGISSRTALIKTRTENVIDSLSIFSGSPEVTVDYSFSLTGRTVTVTVEQGLSIPFQALLTYFNDGDMSLKAQSTAGLYDPDEFIRNTDYIYELSAKVLKQIKESETMEKITSYFKKSEK